MCNPLNQSPDPAVEESLCAAKNGSESALGQLYEDSRGYLLIANRQIDPAFRAKVAASGLVQQAFWSHTAVLPRFIGQPAANCGAGCDRFC